MDYILQKELHERSLSLLELREKAVKRLRTSEDDLYRYRRMNKMQRMQCFYNLSDYEWRVKVCTRSLSFIEGVYERHMQKIIYGGKPTMWLRQSHALMSTVKILEMLDSSANEIYCLPEKGLVEPVGVSYEETYSPWSIGF